MKRDIYQRYAGSHLVNNWKKHTFVAILGAHQRNITILMDTQITAHCRVQSRPAHRTQLSKKFFCLLRYGNGYPLDKAEFINHENTK